MSKKNHLHLVTAASSAAPKKVKTLQASLQRALDQVDELHAFQIQQQGRVEKLLGTLASIEQAHDHYRGLYENSPIGYVTLGEDLAIEAINVTAAAMLGGAKDEILGRNLARYLTAWDSSRFRRSVQNKNRQARHKTLDLSFQQRDGATLQAQCTHVRGFFGDEVVIRLAMIDITERKRSETAIRQLAFHDSLTGLPNRRFLLDRLQHVLVQSAKTRQYGAVLYLDLDDFKRLNDTFGHPVGDLLLRQVADRLTGCIQATDIVARLGGDEFILLFQHLGKDAASARARGKKIGEKVLECLSMSYCLDGYTYQTSGSAGITLFSDAALPVETLLQQADLALYAAKAARPGKLRFFDPEMQVKVVARGVLDADIRQALQEKSFLLHYQPQVDQLGRMTSVEALLRWQHPTRGLLMPGDFIPYAEEKGLIGQMGEQVLEAACKQLRVWAPMPHLAQLRIAINVSALEFCHPDFVSRVMSILDRVGADASKLIFELTERVMLASITETLLTMTALRALGICFSLDDFGTGYSSLSYLQRLPLDQIKIDRSFICNLLTNPSDAVITRSILGLGQSLGLEVLAEGVETEAQRSFLAEHGCCAFQGYLFAQAVPSEDLENS